MRPIDADALIESIEQSKGKNSIYAQFVRAYTKDAPTINATPWIPCEERLPEKEEKSYLVYLDSGNVCECRWWCLDPVFLKPTDHWRWHFMDRPQFTKVLAWMPLPKPYIEEKKDNETDIANED